MVKQNRVQFLSRREGHSWFAVATIVIAAILVLADTPQAQKPAARFNHMIAKLAQGKVAFGAAALQGGMPEVENAIQTVVEGVHRPQGRVWRDV